MIATIHIKKVNQNHSIDAQDQLAIEEPLEIQLQFDLDGHSTQKSISVTMRTPGQDEALATGFLFTEGIIQHREQIKEIGTTQKNTILISLAAGLSPSLQNTDRNFYTTSSCGVCGKSSIDAIRTASVYQHGSHDFRVAASLLYTLPAQTRIRQEVFETTGGLHASALFDLQGKFLMLREDVGRHNALDKIIGDAFVNGSMPLNNTILMLSGRASFELIQKASMAGIKMVAAIGAPSSLAVALANEFDITLIGFLSGQRFNIYSGEKRIKL